MLPASSGLGVERVVVLDHTYVVHLRTTNPTALCPSCSKTSSQVHSHYTRRVADLPWAGKRVEFRLRVRRFRCANPLCRRLTFTERLAPLASYARRTNRMTKTLAQLGLELGGKAGARVAKGLGMPTSHDTMLRIIMKSESDHYHRTEGAEPPLRVVGVDEWAMQRGHRYGTIVVDLERRRPVAVLSDREIGTVAQWLSQHPQLEVVSRDRFGGYAQAATQGAPKAMQVADRWHLLKNLVEAVEEFLQTKRAYLREAARPPSQPAQLEAVSTGTSQAAQRKAAVWKGRQERYQLINELRQQNLGVKKIAARLGLGVSTVWRYFQMDEPPKAKPPTKHTHHILEPYEPYLLGRYNEGARNSRTITAELNGVS